MNPDLTNICISDFISSQEKRDSMTESQVMAEEFRGKISNIAVYDTPINAASTAYRDGTITATTSAGISAILKPIVKHLGRPKATHDAGRI